MQINKNEFKGLGHALQTRASRGIIFYLLIYIFNISNNCLAQQNIYKEWIKNPATNRYSLEQERKDGEELRKESLNYYSKLDIEKLKKDLEDSNDLVRYWAVDNLGHIPENNQISKIEDLLINDPSMTIRISCARSLRYLRSKKSIPVLIKALKTDDKNLKLEVALTLAYSGEKTECFKTLNELEKTADWKTILNIQSGYLDISTKEAIEQLKFDLIHENSYVSVNAAIILAELGYFKEAFPTLKSKLSDSDNDVRGAALVGLEYIGNDKSIELIRSLINDSDRFIREQSKSFLKNCHLN